MSSIGAKVLSRNKLLRALETRMRRKGEKECLATVRFSLEMKMITMWMKTVSIPVDMAESHLPIFMSLKDKSQIIRSSLSNKRSLKNSSQLNQINTNQKQ
jgi:hypothetical protein